jgi:uncharacterized membrane protein (UPF0127 family)
MHQHCFSVLGAIALMSGLIVHAQYVERRGEIEFPDKTRVSVEIADTDAKRQRGLMFRERMAPTDGMVFIFDEKGVYPFWMKNTFIPLDMVWLDETFTIVSIVTAVPCKTDPCPNYTPKAAAWYVVELVAGFAKTHGVKEGDVLIFKNVPTPRRR